MPGELTEGCGDRKMMEERPLRVPHACSEKGTRTVPLSWNTVLAGDSPDAYNEVARPNRVTPQMVDLALTSGHLALPPHSVTILEVE